MADLVRFDYKAREDMFDGHSYNKGGQILNMLRRYVGDDAFFASLKLYLERHKFQPAEVPMLRLCFEEVTGEDLNWFFNQWFYAKGHPEIKVETSYDAAAGKVLVKTWQQQDFSRGIPLYKIPVRVDVYAGGNKIQKTIWITEAEQVNEITGIQTKPDLVNFDADKSLLAEKNEKKSLDEYIFQYTNGSLYLDRYEALEGLKNSRDAKVYETIKLALDDKYYGLREKAIKMLGDYAISKESELKPKMIELVKSDKKSGVRAEALMYLTKNYGGPGLKDIYMHAMNDQSLEVIGTALSGFSNIDAAAALAKAKELENDKSTSILYAVMNVYAEHGGDEQIDFFFRRAKEFSGFSAIGFYNMFGLYLKKVNDENVVKGAEFIRTKIKSNPNRFVAYYAQKAIKDQVNRYQDKEDQLSSQIADAKKENKATADLETQLTNVKSVKEKLNAIYTEVKK